MTEAESGSRWLRRVAQYLVFWTLVGLAFAGQHYLTSAKIGRAASWAVAITGSLADWYVFAALSVPTIALTRHFNLGGRYWRERILLHVLASAIFSLLWILVRAGLAQVLVPLRGVEMPFNELLRYVLVATFFFNVMVYWVVVTGTHALDYYRSLREREVRVLELERRLASARLEALQMQLNPHFLFNALNGIGTLMYRDVELADTMLVKLADLLRHVLDQGLAQRVTLRQELSFLDRYLELEQLRFGDRLVVRREIAETCLEAWVPSLILQPLVENAIKHGIEPMTRPGTVVVRASTVDGSMLHLEVEDDGQGTDPDHGRQGLGIGTSNTRARLKQLYGGQGRFELVPAVGGGGRAVLEFPLDTQPYHQQFGVSGDVGD